LEICSNRQEIADQHESLSWNVRVCVYVCVYDNSKKLPLIPSF